MIKSLAFILKVDVDVMDVIVVKLVFVIGILVQIQ